MHLAADPVGDHGPDAETGIEPLEAEGDSGRAPRVAAGIDHEDDGRSQPLGRRRSHFPRVLPRRPVDGGTRPGRSPGSRIVLLPAPSRLSRQWLSRVSSPITVTGSRRIRTAFPGPPVGTLGASND